MVTQTEARKAIARTIAADERMPTNLDVLIHEPDEQGSDANVTLPLLLVEFDEPTRPARATTDTVGYKTDDNGNRIARVFEKEWHAEARIEIWTADGSSYNVDELGNTLTSVLYGYDSATTGDNFLDADGNPIEEIWNFSLNQAVRDDEIIQTPTVRRWRQMADVYGCQQYVEDEATTITTVEPGVQQDDEPTIQ